MSNFQPDVGVPVAHNLQIQQEPCEPNLKPRAPGASFLQPIAKGVSNLQPGAPVVPNLRFQPTKSSGFYTQIGAMNQIPQAPGVSNLLEVPGVHNLQYEAYNL